LYKEELDDYFLFFAPI